MAAPPVYTFARGEPIIIGRRVLSGDPTGYELVAMVKPAPSAVPAAGVAPVATFTSTFVPASGTIAAHWLLTIAAGLPAGRYATDARFEKDGQVQSISKPAFIVVTESVSGT